MEQPNDATATSRVLPGPASVEPRWPPALAILAFIAMTIVLRLTVAERPSLGVGWLVPALEVVLLIVLVAADPESIARHAKVLRRLAIVLVLSLAIAAVGSTVVMTVDLVRGASVTEDAASLLATGGLVWVGNNIVFGLLYWMFDSGGALARSRRERPYPDLLFPQQTDSELAAPGWRPMFVDYFYLGFTNAMGFSPTDVMPLAAWAKLTMLVHAMISLVIIGLVIARAVSLFS